MKVSEITEADVLEAAIEQFKGNGYTSEAYFSNPSLSDWDQPNKPGPNVGAACAIGGVEQALWKLTGKVVGDEARDFASYGYKKKGDRRQITRLYANTMHLLNEVAKKSPLLQGENAPEPHECPIEQLTFVASKRTVVNTFKKALERARAQS